MTNFDSLSFSPLFEKSLVRVTAEFESSKSFNSVVTDLSKELKRKIGKDESSHNFQLLQLSDRSFRLISPFLLYRDSRLSIIGLFRWIERNATTIKNHEFLIDLKFLDAEKGPFKGTLFNTSTKIENIDRLKFILEFDESRVFDDFPSRRNWYTCQSIQQFDPIQKFIPKENESIDPNLYRISTGKTTGIDFETLINGYLQMRYIGGTDYHKKVNEVLNILNEFCVTAWNCTVNKGFTQDNINKFEKLIQKTRVIRESYQDYALFKKNFPKINFTVDLLSDKKLLGTYYNVIRDRLFDLFSNIEFTKGFELNYDTVFGVIQIRDAKIKARRIQSVDFVNSDVEFGILEKCDFYESTVKDAVISECNLFRYTKVDRSKLINSVVNRTSELNSCTVEGLYGVMNGKMISGTFLNGKIGLFGDLSKDVKIIEYQKLKSGYLVAGDRVIIPTKKFRIE